MEGSVLCVKVSYDSASTSVRSSKKSMFNSLVNELRDAGYRYTKTYIPKGREFYGFVYFPLPGDRESREKVVTGISEVLEREKDRWMVFSRYTSSSIDEFF